MCNVPPTCNAPKTPQTLTLGPYAPIQEISVGFGIRAMRRLKKSRRLRRRGVTWSQLFPNACRILISYVFQHKYIVSGKSLKSWAPDL